MPELFPLAQYWWLYAAFVGGVLVLLGLDLGVLHRNARPVGFREAAAWTAAWVSLALAFDVGLYFWARWAFGRDERLAAVPGFDAGAAAWQTALEFLTGYVVEYSLSVDNIFVFVLVLGYFSVPVAYQHRVLFYGILGALVFRAAFIALGSVLMQFHWVIWLFGAFLIVTGAKLALAEPTVEPERNLLLRLLRRVVPITPRFHGHRFFVRDGGRLRGTPLLVALCCLEATDIVFAVDSVPAIYALTREPFVVFTSNVFAILGLRSLYFLLGGAVEKFHLLRYGLAVVLVFVGLKMVWLDELTGGKFPIVASLGIIVTVIAASIVASLLYPKRAGRAAAPARGEERGRTLERSARQA
ncbi:MAG: TerC family protein [Candidatus Rokubacteria bacterium]|nr:TerC family protein [Candidatus Rokubacteria bacterium]